MLNVTNPGIGITNPTAASLPTKHENDDKTTEEDLEEKRTSEKDDHTKHGNHY